MTYREQFRAALRRAWRDRPSSQLEPRDEPIAPAVAAYLKTLEAKIAAEQMGQR
jgi:hypothetical protein